MNVAFLIFDKFTALDAMGPYEVLSRFPGVELKWVAKEPGPKTADTGMLTVIADSALGDVTDPEILLIPGGEGNRALMRDDEFLDWLRSAHETSSWTASVCTGALVLGAAGILDGVRATTHWAYREELAKLGAEVSTDRVVIDGKVATAAGVSSGIDMALTLVGEIAGPEAAQAMQLGIEYDPQPPFDAGSPEKAPPEIVEFVRNLERA